MFFFHEKHLREMGEGEIGDFFFFGILSIRFLLIEISNVQFFFDHLTKKKLNKFSKKKLGIDDEQV